MKRLLLFLFAVALGVTFLVQTVNAQVSVLLNPTGYGYTFLNTTTTYTPLTGATVFQSGAALNTNTNSSAITLPFVFTYNGIKENTIFINNNGYITFALPQTTLTVYTPLSSTTTSGYDGVIAGLANNLVAAASGTPEISYGTNAGGDFVIQYQDLAITSYTSTRITFQIVLMVDGKTIQIVYGPNNTGQSGATGSQVGLRGTNDEDWNNRSLASGGNWNTTGGAAGATNSNTMTWTVTSTLPTSGRTFQWSPTAYVPTYLATPFATCEEFTTWVNGAGPANIPSTNWASNGYGNASWQIDNCPGTTTTTGWGSATSYGYTPVDYVAASGGHSARFHSGNTNSPQVGYLDYYVDFSSATGVVTMDFYAINTSGTDILQVFLSTDGGSTFSQIGTNIGVLGAWTKQTISLGAITSATSIIRFKATADFGSTDIGLDHVCLSLPAACPTPLSLAAGSVTANSASISWDCAGCTGTFELDYGSNGHAAGSGTILTGVTSPFNLNPPLTSNTAYTVYVRQDCSGSANGFSNWSDAANFTTACDAENIPTAVQGFESASLPACWSTALISGTNNWATATSNDGVPSAHTGTYFMGKVYTTSDALVFSQPINMTTSASGGRINVWIYRNPANFATDRIRFYVNTAQSITGATQILEIFPLSTIAPTVPSAGWYNYTADIPASYNTNTLVYIIAQGTTSGGFSSYGIGFDDFKVEAIPSCIAPTLQTVTNKNSLGADLGWTSPDSFFDVFIQGAATPAPDGLTTPTADNVSGNSYTWAGGSPATPYYWWVRTDCDAGGGTGVSTWTGPNSFTTLLCDPVDQCNYTFRMTDAYGDGWNGNTMAVKQGGVTVQTLAHTASGTAPVDVLVGLCHGVGFELFWNSGGTYPEEVGIEILDAFGTSLYYKAPGSGSQNTSLYTGTTNCTPPACIAPTVMTVSNITPTGADLSWTSLDSFFDIFIDIAGAPAPSEGTTPTIDDNEGNSYTWTDGSPATAYQYYVRADCSQDNVNVSYWAGPVEFTTLCDVAATPFIETVESDIPCWFVSGGTYNWGLFSSASGYGTGSKSFRAVFFGINDPTPFYLFSPEFDASTLTNPVLEFDYAYATYSGGEVDEMKIYYSTDGGATSSLLLTMTGGVNGIMNTGGIVTTSFIPTSGQWATRSVVLPAGTNMVIFGAISDFGNNLYIDNIEIRDAATASTWNGTSNNKWYVATNWTPSVPGSGTNVIIPGGLTNYPILTSAASCNNFTIESGGSFIGSEFLTIGGTTEIQRSVSGYTSASDGWHLLSSPVVNQAISGDWTPGTGYDFYALDESRTWEYWLNQKVPANNMTNFIPGKGYLVAYEISGTKAFTGAMNTAAVTMSGLTNTPASSYPGWHLVGNPFTSAINYTTGTWTKTNIDVEMQVWSSVDASYKTSTEVGGIIPSMNGFMIHTTGSGELTIPLDARVHNSAGWYKSNEDFILLKANDPVGHSSQSSLVRFNTQATEAFDNEFDSYFLAGFAPMFYSKSAGEGFALNTLTELTNETVIPFDFIKNESSDFNIELTQAVPGALIYLTDKKTNTITNLTQTPVYPFTAVDGDVADRFLLTFGSVGIDNPDASQIIIYGFKDMVFVKGAKSGSEVAITNLLGQVMMNTTVKGDVAIVNGRNLADGIYLVSVISGNSVVSKKVVLEK